MTTEFQKRILYHRRYYCNILVRVMSSHLRHELIEISMPVIQWMLAKAPTPSKKVCSRRKRHGDFEKVKQKWSSRHRAAHDNLIYRPDDTFWKFAEGFGRLRRGKAYETRHATAMLIAHFKLSTCSYFNLHEIQSLCCKRILSVRPDIPSFAETGKIYICKQ